MIISSQNTYIAMVKYNDRTNRFNKDYVNSMSQIGNKRESLPEIGPRNHNNRRELLARL